MIKFVSKLPPTDRRNMALDPTTVASIAIKPGMVVKENASKFAVKADGAAVVGGPAFAFVDTSRKDVQGANALSVIDGPFTADIDTDCYSGNPALDAALSLDTAGNVGKLVTQVITANDCTTLQKVLAYCVRTADADGFIRVKVIR